MALGWLGIAQGTPQQKQQAPCTLPSSILMPGIDWCREEADSKGKESWRVEQSGCVWWHGSKEMENWHLPLNQHGREDYGRLAVWVSRSCSRAKGRPMSDGDSTDHAAAVHLCLCWAEYPPELPATRVGQHRNHLIWGNCDIKLIYLFAVEAILYEKKGNDTGGYFNS